jgi:hypothetical protein
MHDPDRNITMPQGTERDYPSTAENDINARLRHCRVKVKRWKRTVEPSPFMHLTPPFMPIGTWVLRDIRTDTKVGTAADHLMPAHGVML